VSGMGGERKFAPTINGSGYAPPRSTGFALTNTPPGETYCKRSTPGPRKAVGMRSTGGPFWVNLIAVVSVVLVAAVGIRLLWICSPRFRSPLAGA
jgi:hypothetical protein